ncbi:unnamed protein product [Blepharisma stoltei]|uniref:Uncharacterized protein n=1 Tax=Blepharisma stoltei TaxID=1481888 RepID=A0AAU9IJ44_9CILI|nr:unnamed protein product [Blepharisma stoltei]
MEVDEPQTHTNIMRNDYFLFRLSISTLGNFCHWELLLLHTRQNFIFNFIKMYILIPIFFGKIVLRKIARRARVKQTLFLHITLKFLQYVKCSV